MIIFGREYRGMFIFRIIAPAYQGRIGRVLFGIILSWSAAAAPAQNAPAPSRHLQPMDIFALEFAEDPGISPDGRTLVYTRVKNDIKTDHMVRTIWLVDTMTGEQHPLPGGRGQSSDPSWLPDGTRLAYWANVDGKTQYYIYSLRDQSSKQIPGLPDSAGSIKWSPDGRSIAFSMFIPDPATPPLGGSLPKPEGAEWAPPLEQATAFGTFGA